MNPPVFHTSPPRIKTPTSGQPSFGKRFNIIKERDLMNIILWILFGALAGWIASIIVGKNAQMGALANIIVGIVGAGLGGWLAEALGMGGVDGFNLWSLIVAAAGAALLLVIINLVRRGRAA